jgi:uncharacterized delta-60 repeat protein
MIYALMLKTFGSICLIPCILILVNETATAGPHCAKAVALGSDGSCYVTGYSDGLDTGLDYATIKYDRDGNVVWVQRYNGPGNRDDYATSITAYKNTSIFVTGQSYNTDTQMDITTIKYDINGNSVWKINYNGSDNGDDGANSVVVDDNGSVVVAGYSYKGGVYKGSLFTIVKYGSDGEEMWDRFFPSWLITKSSTNIAKGLCVDSAGNIYGTGSVKSTVSRTHDFAAMKLDPNGRVLWAKTINGNGNGQDNAKALVVDSKGNLFITGDSQGDNTGFDSLTAAYSPKGIVLWKKAFNGKGKGDDGANAIAVDKRGHVFVTGYSQNKLENEVNCLTVKYDTQGKTVWTRGFNGSTGGYDEGRTITTDNQGNVYVAGASSDSKGNLDFLTLKYDQKGRLAWARTSRCPGGDDTGARAMALDDSGDIYVTGSCTRETGDTCYLTIKYNANGEMLWTRKYPGE